MSVGTPRGKRGRTGCDRRRTRRNPLILKQTNDNGNGGDDDGDKDDKAATASVTLIRPLTIRLSLARTVSFVPHLVARLPQCTSVCLIPRCLVIQPVARCNCLVSLRCFKGDPCCIHVRPPRHLAWETCGKLIHPDPCFQPDAPANLNPNANPPGLLNTLVQP